MIGYCHDPTCIGTTSFTSIAVKTHNVVLFVTYTIRCQISGYWRIEISARHKTFFSLKKLDVSNSNCLLTRKAVLVEVLASALRFGGWKVPSPSEVMKWTYKSFKTSLPDSRDQATRINWRSPAKHEV